jgi:hypothetical protein
MTNQANMTELEQLAASLEAKSPADQLRVAAGLLDGVKRASLSDGGMSDRKRIAVLGVARAIVDRVSTELGALLLVLEELAKAGDGR